MVSARVVAWHVAHGTVGRGHLYQGRFKTFPIQEDEHFLTACRYVERNALTAGAVERAQDWRWSSLWARRQGDEKLQALLSRWPVPRPKDWLRFVNRPMTEREVDAIQTSISRNRPLGRYRLSLAQNGNKL
jgi:putative transposase